MCSCQCPVFRGYWDNPSELMARPASLSSTLDDIGDTQAAKDLTAALRALPSGLAGLPIEAQFDAIRKLGAEEKAALLAVSVALSLKERSIDQGPITVPPRPDRRSIGWQSGSVVSLAADRGQFLGADSDANGACDRQGGAGRRLGRASCSG